MSNCYCWGIKVQTESPEGTEKNRQLKKWKCNIKPCQERRKKNQMIRIAVGGQSHWKAQTVYIWGETSVRGEKLILQLQVNLEATHQVVNISLSGRRQQKSFFKNKTASR